MSLGVERRPVESGVVAEGGRSGQSGQLVQRPGAGLSLTSLTINHGTHVSGSGLGDMEECTQ